ncbi:unnamed protein product [Moneuplotes crassus]|uniref:Uncharacterized protein n=1 Tax=Euplotes crassus TaxID=5936 RepID=A0AAD1UN19_EUPCR|nr:unnamed protein product [Moneuplotes crassus]
MLPSLFYFISECANVLLDIANFDQSLPARDISGYPNILLSPSEVSLVRAFDFLCCRSKSSNFITENKRT